MNQLRHETSPYLLQHANNPVEWYAWKPEAFEKAKAEEKPILVSIGYSTCHWCHVMERESFENEAVAAFMNEHFINIKVDREERPDVDQIYMEACQAINGSGGWPLNCFLLPDRRPYFAGTYYPPQQMHNRPSWMQLLQYMKDAFLDRRDEVEKQADQLMDTVSGSDQLFLKNDLKGIASEQLFSPEDPTTIYENLSPSFDLRNGGFGGAPKFPGTMGLRYLLEYSHLSDLEAPLKHFHFSLHQMIRGGIYDQLGGGFARYATDQQWLVPHFEKMLYDNALLTGLLADAHRKTPNALYEETIHETIGWVKREMLSPEGGFYAALDADSEGEEGKFYVWSHQEVQELLGEKAALFCAFYDITPSGNWEGVNILHRSVSESEFAAERGMATAEMKAILADGRMKLFNARTKRIRPGLDDKILLGWNAMMATALAKAYAALGEPDYLKMAESNVQFLLENLQQPDGKAFYHTYKEGQTQYDAFLDDYALLIEALIELYQVNYNSDLLRKAEDLCTYLTDHFLDSGNNLFYFTGQRQNDIPLRRKELYDSATPSGNSTMVHNLHRLGLLLGKEPFSRLAVEMLRGVKTSVAKYPGSFGRWARAFLYQSYPYYEVALVGQQAAAKGSHLQQSFIPNAVVMASPIASEDWPLLAGRGSGGDTNIYVCQAYACKRPVSAVEEALVLLSGKESSSKIQTRHA
jgi:uncharacterized protein YyaL (SSP411 family)